MMRIVSTCTLLAVVIEEIRGQECLGVLGLKREVGAGGCGGADRGVSFVVQFAVGELVLSEELPYISVSPV